MAELERLRLSVEVREELDGSKHVDAHGWIVQGTLAPRTVSIVRLERYYSTFPFHDRHEEEAATYLANALVSFGYSVAGLPDPLGLFTLSNRGAKEIVNGVRGHHANPSQVRTLIDAFRAGQFPEVQVLGDGDAYAY